MDREYHTAKTQDLFRGVVERHDSWKESGFRAWRIHFAAHAEPIVDFFKTKMPGATRDTHGFDRASLVALLREGVPDNPKTEPAPRRWSVDTFNPWDNWWSGRWRKGEMHYHIWDKTIGARGTQLVTQSRRNFAHRDNLARMIKADEVDLAINVVSDPTGITGWVSKRQADPSAKPRSGYFELPHLGYRINACSLIWIARTFPGTKAPAEYWGGHDFLLLHEWTSSAVAPTVYGIEGRYVRINDGAVKLLDPKPYHGKYERYDHGWFRGGTERSPDQAIPAPFE